jgi:hypothetical protein
MKQDNERFCQDCTAIINNNTEICPICGKLQVTPDDVLTSSSQKIDSMNQLDLKDAKLAHTLGILSVVLVCCNGGVITIALAFIGFSKGKSAIKEYEANEGKYTLRSYNQAKSAKLLSIIGLILSGLHLIALVIYFILVFALGIAGGLQQV